MKHFYTILLAATTAIGLSAVPASAPGTVTLNCVFENCSSVDSITLYDFEGVFYRKLQTVHADAQHQFKFQVPKTAAPQFYFVGVNDNNHVLKTVLLGTENEVQLKGPCFDMAQVVPQNSRINEDYRKALDRVNELKVRMGAVIQEYQQNYADESKRKPIEDKMGLIDAEKVKVLDSLKKANPFVARVVALDTYTSFQNNKEKAKYANEIAYFAERYFQYANITDAAYADVPFVFDMFRNYTQVLILPQVALTQDQIKTYLDQTLAKFPTKNRAYKYALGGILSVMIERSAPNLPYYGEKYFEYFRNDDANTTGLLSSYINQAKANMLGGLAPDFTMNDTSGKPRTLSAMKGKYVLLDFWASWCGPCRRENPTVVALYNKYKTKGFDVFSVSLDQNKDPWLKAIQADNLIWNNHVSDLKGWGNEAARLYSVTSIPNPILLGKDGTIIARGASLRGEALEAKLKELMGE